MIKTYLGDSVYIEPDGHMLMIYTDNGMGNNNMIWIEPEVAQELIKYLQDWLKENGRS